MATGYSKTRELTIGPSGTALSVYHLTAHQNIDAEIQDISTFLSLFGTVSSPYTALGFVAAKGFRAASSGNQGFVNPSTETQVVLDDEEFDVGSNYDTGNRQFVAPVAGYYRFNARITYTSTEDSKLYRARIHKNGSTIDETFTPSGVGTSQVSCTISSVHHLAVNDIIKLIAFHNQAADATIVGSNSYSSFLEVTLVAKD